MQILRHRPQVRRGVTQLMYVGDDEAVEKAVLPNVPLHNAALLLAIGATVATTGTTRRIAAGISLALFLSRVAA